LREQKTSQGNITSKSINFINTSASIWGSYIKFVNMDCKDLGFYILDFITEAIQGPCQKNQLDLYQNKIIDYSKDFMNDFTSPRDYEARGFYKQKEKDILNEIVLCNIKM